MIEEAMIAWRAGLRYRILYACARGFLDRADRTAYTREEVRQVKGEDLLVEVLRVAEADREDPDEMELAREAVDDARTGREPRW